MKKIRVLIITHAPWRNDTSGGNSYSNIFNGLNDSIEFAQIYIRDGMPENDIVHKYFQISEKELIKSVVNRKEVGKYFVMDDPMDTQPVEFSNTYNCMRRLRWNIFLLCRDIISSMGGWKSKALNKFLDEFQPDIIFGTLGFIPVINQLMVYAKNRTGAVLIPYPWDDWYSINKNYISPIYYIRIFLERYYIKKTVTNSAFLYVITEDMRDKYNKIFKKDCKVLRKGYDFDIEKKYELLVDNQIKMIYTGNIGDERWKVLSMIAESIAKLNGKYDRKLHLYIYTLSPISNEMEAKLNIEGASTLMGAVPSKKIPEITDKAHVLVHVEPVNKVKLENSMLSFSTKIVDYMYQKRCILAVGGQNASMKYLKDNNAAIVVNELDAIDNVLEKIILKPELLSDYANNAWECGKKNHSISEIQKMIISDFKLSMKSRAY